MQEENTVLFCQSSSLHQSSASKCLLQWLEGGGVFTFCLVQGRWMWVCGECLCVYARVGEMEKCGLCLFPLPTSIEAIH